MSATSGSDAASAIVSPTGIRARSPSSTAINSAKVPMRSLSGRAYTSSPGANLRTDRPTCTTTPARSLPRTNGVLYGKINLNSPAMILPSSGFTPEARIRTSTSPSPITGSGTCPARNVIDGP